MRRLAWIAIGPPCPCHGHMSESLYVLPPATYLARVLLAQGRSPLAVLVEADRADGVRRLRRFPS